SSVGVYKVSSIKYLVSSIKKALKYDTKVIVEEEVKGREIEVSVLGNEDPIASVPGEVIPVGHEFYDYEAKYLDENGARLEIPAKLMDEVKKRLSNEAIKAYKVLECSGMARVDMFLTPSGKIVVNEINTLPGFTSISMYPKLWEASGLSYPKLLDRLIELALEKKKQKDGLKRSFR
ncbi:MAG: D-alanine--D-alanine ligase A, partial [Patescibacteria group bacterium]